MRNFSEKKLDKEGWLCYINDNASRIGVLVEMKYVYEDLLKCNTLNENEKAFLEALEEYKEKNGSMRR